MITEKKSQSISPGWHCALFHAHCLSCGYTQSCCLSPHSHALILTGSSAPENVRASFFRYYWIEDTNVSANVLYLFTQRIVAEDDPQLAIGISHFGIPRMRWSDRPCAFLCPDEQMRTSSFAVTVNQLQLSLWANIKHSAQEILCLNVLAHNCQL